MKKILVATDFSAPALNAVKYAMAACKAIHANLTLVNAYMVPIPVSETSFLSLKDLEEIPARIDAELKVLVKKLLDDSCNTGQSQACPQVDYRFEEGGVIEVVNTISAELTVDMVVMGLTGASRLINFILGSTSMAMMEKGKCPLLLIPQHASFNGVKKIVYAGQLSYEDITPLKYVCKLASCFNAEVSVLHVIDMRKDLNTGMHTAGEDFVDQLRKLSGYNRLRYESVWNSEVDQGLEWIAEQKDLDMVSMLHHRHSIIQEIFSHSKTKTFARYSNIPLLVFPPSAAGIDDN